MTYLYVTDWNKEAPVATLKALAEARRLLSNPSDVKYTLIKELSPFPIGADNNLENIAAAAHVLNAADCEVTQSEEELTAESEEPEVEITKLDWQQAMLYMAFASGNFEAAKYFMVAMNRITGDLEGAIAAIDATFPTGGAKSLLEELGITDDGD